MKRIIISSIVIVGAASIITIGSTGAFFSDTEKSTGNAFTAGAIDLKVDSEQHYNGNTCVKMPPVSQFATNGGPAYQWVGTSTYPVPGSYCDGTWNLSNLVIDHNHFFDFMDVKPGDAGEDTISIHIDNNPAWACMDIKTTQNAEHNVTGPEIAAGDDPTKTGPWDGELGRNIQVFIWMDDASSTDPMIKAGDNIFEPQNGELALVKPTNIFDSIGTTTIALADKFANSGQPLNPGVTNNVGMAWCAGTMSVDYDNGKISCDGTTMGNDSQTDMLQADIGLRVEQSRNNGDFTCSPAELKNN